MRVEPTKQASSGRSSETPRDATLAPAEHDADSRALVVLAPAATQAPSANYRQSPLLAAFLAQLIATKDQLPQTRERRRAEPAEALAAYRATDALTGH
jgi:hypothetical protein